MQNPLETAKILDSVLHLPAPVIPLLITGLGIKFFTKCSCCRTNLLPKGGLGKDEIVCRLFGKFIETDIVAVLNRLMLAI